MNTPTRTVLIPTVAHKVLIRNTYIDCIRRGGITGVPDNVSAMATSDIVNKTIDDVSALPLRTLGLYGPRLLEDLIAAYICGGVLIAKIISTKYSNVQLYHPGYIGAYILGYTHVLNVMGDTLTNAQIRVIENLGDIHYVNTSEVDHILDIADVFTSSDGYDALVEYIHNILTVQPYDEWYVKHRQGSAICECYGDYRIRKFNSHFLDKYGKMKEGYGNI